MRYNAEKTQPYVFHQVYQLFKASLLIALIMMASRLFLGIKFGEAIVFKKNLALTFESLFLGLRYDLIPISYIMLVPFIVTTSGLIINRERYLKLIPHLNRLWVYGFFVILSFIIICDIGFYSFFQDHINILFFGLWEDDTEAVLTSIHKNYNLSIWLSLIIGAYVLIYLFIKNLFKTQRIDLFYGYPIGKEGLALFFISGLTIIAFFGRGNFSKQPLSIEDAVISDIGIINNLSINGVIALKRAIKIRLEFGEEKVRYLNYYGYEKLSEAINDVAIFRPELNAPQQQPTDLNALKKTTSEKKFLQENRPHVILVIMESFGSMWWEYGEEIPFLGTFKRHSEEDFTFLNFLSSENGTIGSVASILSGLPIRPGTRFLSEGKYAAKQIPSFASLPYVEAGYMTNFVYGGKLSWRNLGSFLSKQGWHHLVDSEEIKEVLRLQDKPASEIGNEWGLFDEYLYEYLKVQIDASTEPQFFVVLTTTNHPPYEIPSKYTSDIKLNSIPKNLKSKFSKPESEVIERMKSCEYANSQLGNFLTFVKSSELKNRVVVSATGDHSFWIGHDEGVNRLSNKYAVPFYLYLPNELRPKDWDSKNWGSHIDIMPTLYERTLSNIEYWSFGQDMFNSNGVAINSTGLVVNKEAVSYGNGSFCWVNQNEKRTEKCEQGIEHSKLNSFRKGLISVSDEFLREL
jgi:hypothetical protein